MIRCLQCHNKVKTKQHKYCSWNCYLIYNKAIIKNCQVCNKKNRTSKNTFCSTKCSNQIRVKLINLECSNCKQTFQKRPWQIKNSKKVFCSSKCCLTQKSKVKVKCITCKKEFLIYQSRASYYSKFYCNNKCRLKSNSKWLTGVALSKNNNYDKFTRSLRCTAQYLSWKKQCRERDQNACTKCSRTSQLTVHHIFTIGQFIKKHGLNREEIIKDTLFYNTSNGITLCRSCHLKEHILKEKADEQDSRDQENHQ